MLEPDAWPPPLTAAGAPADAEEDAPEEEEEEEDEDVRPLVPAAACRTRFLEALRPALPPRFLLPLMLRLSSLSSRKFSPPPYII